MTKLRNAVFAASILLATTFNITADAPPPTCCHVTEESSTQLSPWLIIKILLGLS